MKKQILMSVLMAVLGVMPAVHSRTCSKKNDAVIAGTAVSLATLLAGAISNKSLDAAVDQQLVIAGAVAAFGAAEGFTHKALAVLDAENYYNYDQKQCRTEQLYNAAKDSVACAAAFLGTPLFLYCLHNSISKNKTGIDLLIDAVKKATSSASCAATIGAILSGYRYLLLR